MTTTDAPIDTPDSTPDLPSLWRNRDFNLLWGGLLLSNLGGSMATLAFPLVVLSLGGSAVTAGLIATGALAVEMICHLPSGVLVDRVDRRRLIICCDLLRLVAFLVLGSVLLTGHARIWMVLVVAAVEAVCDTPSFGATFAAVRNLVRPDQVQEAMARGEARQYAVSLAGPPLGGLVFSLGRSLPFLVNAVSYVFSLVAVLLIRTPLQEERTAQEESTTALQDVRTGLRYVMQTPFIRSTVLIGAPLNLAFNGTLFGIVLLLRGHGVAPALIGTASTIFAVGGLLGAFSAAWVLRRASVSLLCRAFTVSAVPLLLLVWPLSASPLAAAPAALLAFIAPALNAGLFGHLATIVPDQLQGRVMSALIVTIMSMTALAPVGAALLVQHFGAAGLSIGAASVMAVSAVTALTSKGIREIG